jgi:subtilisin-like proprotein convertase family protein
MRGREKRVFALTSDRRLRRSIHLNAGFGALLVLALFSAAGGAPLKLASGNNLAQPVPDAGVLNHSLTGPQDLVSQPADWPGTPLHSFTATVALDHSWVGRLIIDLLGPEDPQTGDRPQIRLMDRPGYYTFPGNSGGHAENLASDHPITFDDNAMRSSNFIGSNVPSRGTNAVVGDGGPSTFYPAERDADNFEVRHFLSSMPTDPDGQWTLRIEDVSADQRLGTLQSWSLQAEPLPEPSSLLAGLTLAAALLPRRRRR